MDPDRLERELALAGPEHLDPAYVAGYDRKARVDPSADVDELRGRGLGSSSALIDFGAGTGTFALAAAPVCARVIAVDVSPAMVAALRAKVAGQQVANVECVQAGFLSYEHEGAPVDFIYTRHALHHLPDYWKAIALQRMARLLRPEGILRLLDLVFSFGLAEAEARVTDWLAAAPADSPGGGWTRAELEAHLREEYSTFTWLLEPMLEQAGFEIAAADYSQNGIYAAYTCIKLRS